MRSLLEAVQGIDWSAIEDVSGAKAAGEFIADVARQAEWNRRRADAILALEPSYGAVLDSALQSLSTRLLKRGQSEKLALWIAEAQSKKPGKGAEEKVVEWAREVERTILEHPISTISGDYIDRESTLRHMGHLLLSKCQKHGVSWLTFSRDIMPKLPSRFNRGWALYSRPVMGELNAGSPLPDPAADMRRIASFENTAQGVWEAMGDSRIACDPRSIIDALHEASKDEIRGQEMRKREHQTWLDKRGASDGKRNTIGLN